MSQIISNGLYNPQHPLDREAKKKV